MECKQDQNRNKCSCTYEPCPRKGICCECVAYHKSRGEIPGCLFPAAAERSYDRSISHFIKVMSR